MAWGASSGSICRWCWASRRCNYVLRFVKWQYYLKLIGVQGFPRGHSALSYLAGLGMVVTPGKVGEWLKCYLLRELHGTPFTRSAPILIAERLTDLPGDGAPGVGRPGGLPRLMAGIRHRSGGRCGDVLCRATPAACLLDPAPAGTPAAGLPLCPARRGVLREQLHADVALRDDVDDAAEFLFLGLRGACVLRRADRHGPGRRRRPAAQGLVHHARSDAGQRRAR